MFLLEAEMSVQTQVGFINKQKDISPPDFVWWIREAVFNLNWRNRRLCGVAFIETVSGKLKVGPRTVEIFSTDWMNSIRK